MAKTIRGPFTMICKRCNVALKMEFAQKDKLTKTDQGKRDDSNEISMKISCSVCKQKRTYNIACGHQPETLILI